MLLILHVFFAFKNLKYIADIWRQEFLQDLRTMVNSKAVLSI